MLRFVIRKIIEEEIPVEISENAAGVNTRSDLDVEKYYNSCKISKMF